MSKTEKKIYWEGSAPVCCEWCKGSLDGVFIDGKVRFRACWGKLCAECHEAHGIGLGLGKGQKYVKQPDGKWLKVEG